MFRRADWNSDSNVIKTELDCDTHNAKELDPAQENFICCGDGSDDESFLPETRTYNNSRSDDESDDNFHQEYESENFVPECPRFVKTIPTNRSKKKQETNNADQNSLQSKLCDTRFTTLKSRLDHIHTGNKPYECKICSKQYSTATSLETHAKTHRECLASVAVHIKLKHNSVSPETNLNDNSDKFTYQCSFCDKKFVTLESKLIHENIHTDYKPYKCATTISLKNHTSRTHSGKEKKNWQLCSVCGKAFSSVSILNIHIREKHLPDTDPRRYFKCSRCDSKFDTEYHLRVHNLTHKNVRTYTCDYCQREYNNRKNFVNHMYAIHSNLRTIYSCSYCPKGFRSRDHRDDHENTHTGKRPNQCMLCSKDFASTAALRRHTKAHKDDTHKLSKTETTNSDSKDLAGKFHKKLHKRTKAQLLTRTDSSSIADSKGKYPCQFCTAVFRYKDKRDSHLNKHTGQKPHQCSVCLKKFMSQAYLSKHEKLLHLSEAGKATAVKYECSFCSKIYHRKKVFDKHLKSHTGVLPFQCEFCSKGYMIQWGLNRHMKKGCTISK